MSIKMSVDLKRNNSLEDYAKQFPKDMATALTRTAKSARMMLIRSIGNYIDRPTPFTVRGFYFKSATAKAGTDLKTSNSASGGRSAGFMVAEVGTINHEYSKHFLRPQTGGGERSSKGSELRMRRAGLIGQDEYIAPGPAAHLDQYGNMRGQDIIRLLSQVKALSGAGEGFTGNRRESPSNAFFATINGHKGVWERRGKRNIRLMLQVVSKPNYKAKFPMQELVKEHVQMNIENEFWKAWKEGQDRKIVKK